jgi:hypothetical protein
MHRRFLLLTHQFLFFRSRIASRPKNKKKDGYNRSSTMRSNARLSTIRKWMTATTRRSDPEERSNARKRSRRRVTRCPLAKDKCNTRHRGEGLKFKRLQILLLCARRPSLPLMRLLSLPRQNLWYLRVPVGTKTSRRNDGSSKAPMIIVSSVGISYFEPRVPNPMSISKKNLSAGATNKAP